MSAYDGVPARSQSDGEFTVDRALQRTTLNSVKTTNLPSEAKSRATGAFPPILVLALGLALSATFRSNAADEAAAQKLLAESRAKETHAQELRAAASAAAQKSNDDQLEAAAEERDARILVAQALKLMGADANKQKAFQLRGEARKLNAEATHMLVLSRNSEQKAAQEKKNAVELNKAMLQAMGQPTIVASLEGEVKAQREKAAADQQEADREKYAGQQTEERAKAAWAEAEKLDPSAQVVPLAEAKSHVAQARTVK